MNYADFVSGFKLGSLNCHCKISEHVQNCKNSERIRDCKLCEHIKNYKISERFKTCKIRETLAKWRSYTPYCYSTYTFIKSLFFWLLRNRRTFKYQREFMIVFSVMLLLYFLNQDSQIIYHKLIGNEIRISIPDIELSGEAIQQGHWKDKAVVLVGYPDDENLAVIPYSQEDYSNGRIIHDSKVKREPYRLLRSRDLLPDYRSLFNSHPALPRLLPYTVYLEAVHLLGSFSNLLLSHDISFIMTGGTLLGSYYFHDLIPWNDDLDLLVDIYDHNRLMTLFNSTQFTNVYGAYRDPKYGLAPNTSNRFIRYDNLKTECAAPNIGISCIHKWKIYYKMSPKAQNHNWSFPNIDVYFTLNNGSHVYNLENWNKSSVTPTVVKVTDYYPTVLRPFNRYWVPGPKNPEVYKNINFKNGFLCKHENWFHAMQRLSFKYEKIQSDCDLLRTHYQYVTRRKLFNNGTIPGSYYPVLEILMYNTSMLYSVLIEN